MENNFSKIKNYILELGLNISLEKEDDQILVIQDENLGIKNLVIGCADPILIMEQYILDVKKCEQRSFSGTPSKKPRHCSWSFCSGRNRR